MSDPKDNKDKELNEGQLDSASGGAPEPKGESDGLKSRDLDRISGGISVSKETSDQVAQTRDKSKGEG